MLIEIQEAILKKYPEIQIGYLIAEVVVKKSDPYVETLKAELRTQLPLDLNATNYVLNPQISLWRKIYEEDFGVKAKSYRSSVEALLKRVITGNPLWNICNIVDLYNCCSITTLLPMGGYDLKKIQGNIQIRYAQQGELFLGLGQKEKIQAESKHVVYADQEQILCWLWNHKDGAATCIDNESRSVIFFIDGFDHEKVSAALKMLSTHLKAAECMPTQMGILCQFLPIGEVCF